MQIPKIHHNTKSSSVLSDTYTIEYTNKLSVKYFKSNICGLCWFFSVLCTLIFVYILRKGNIYESKVIGHLIWRTRVLFTRLFVII
jgi:hypothetical protein